ncbi:hypothetical protein Tco_0965625 [Tanacetum coccineum]
MFLCWVLTTSQWKGPIHEDDNMLKSRCTSVDHVDKDFVMDDPEFKAKDNEEGSYSDTFLSTPTDHLLLDTVEDWQPNDDWAMASPYLSDMLLRYEYPLYYADGVKYGVPWFVNSVKKDFAKVTILNFPFAEIIVLSLDSSDDRKGPSKASVTIFEGPSVQRLLDHYGYNDIEEYLSWNHFPSTDKKNTNKDMTDKDITNEDCIHESNYKRQRGKESCHMEADHVLVKDQSILGSLTW